MRGKINMKEIEKIEASIYLYDCLKEVFEECAVKFMEELKNKFPETQILYFNKDEIREIYSDSNIAPGIYIELDKAKKEGIDYYFTLKVEINRDELCLCFGFDSKIKKEKKEEISAIKLKDMKNIPEKFYKKLTDLESKLEKKNELEKGKYAVFINLENTNFRKVSIDNKFLINLLEDDTREKEVERVHKEIEVILKKAGLK